jgi:predicted ATPase/DNA-binding CsgD family transcriptional regulator
MPNAAGELVGRGRDMAVIERGLRAARLVTIAGLGGVGKTTLAHAVAARQAAAGRRIAVVDLAPLRSPRAVLGAIATVVGALEDPDRSLLEAIASALAAGPTLLILDNVEHVLAAGPDVEDLLAIAPELRVVATSRVPLGLAGEAVIPLGPLGLPTSMRDVERAPASALFLRRARARGRLERLEPDDAAAIVDITGRLDGLPLGLELAAGWTGVLTPRAISRRLAAGHLDLRGADPRQASLASIVEATLGFVDERAARQFPPLGAFAGSFDEAAAAAVTDDSGILQGLRSLESAGLVRVAADASGEPRFELLESVRGVADGLLDDGRRRAAWRRHAAHYAELAVAAASAIRTSSFSDQVAGAELGGSNVLVAYDRAMALGDREIGLRIATALATRAMQTGILREALARLEAAHAATGLSALPAALHSDALNALVSLRGALGQVEGQEAGARMALAQARASGDPVRIVRTLITLGNWTTVDRAAPYLEAAELAEVTDFGWGAATAWSSLADVRWQAGEVDSAIEAYIRAETASEGIGDDAGLANALVGHGELELNAGRIAAGLRHLDRALALLRSKPGLPFFVTGALSLQAMGRTLAGDETGAYATLAEAADRVVGAESIEDQAAWLEGAAIVLAHRHPAVAARALGAIDGLMEELGPPRQSIRLLAQVGRDLERSTGRPRVERERASGRTANRLALIGQLVRIVRRAAGPSATRIAAPHGRLSAREQEILASLSVGRTDREIAAELGISPKTVSVHVANLKAKLGVETRVEAALYARERLGDPGG